MEDIERRSGWTMFAAVVLFAVGILRIISAISYFADSRKVNDLSLGLFGDNLWAWGLWDLGIAILALYGAYSLLGGGTFGKVIAYLWAVAVIVNSFLIMGVAPWYAFTMIALAVLVVYGAVSEPGRGTRQAAT
jgi:hypothetical protein